MRLGNLLGLSRILYVIEKQGRVTSVERLGNAMASRKPEPNGFGSPTSSRVPLCKEQRVKVIRSSDERLQNWNRYAGGAPNVGAKLVDIS